MCFFCFKMPFPPVTMPLTTLRILVLGTGRSVTQQGNSPNGLVTLDFIRRENSASPYRTECQKYNTTRQSGYYGSSNTSRACPQCTLGVRLEQVRGEMSPTLETPFGVGRIVRCQKKKEVSAKTLRAPRALLPGLMNLAEERTKKFQKSIMGKRGAKMQTGSANGKRRRKAQMTALEARI